MFAGSTRSNWRCTLELVIEFVPATSVGQLAYIGGGTGCGAPGGAGSRHDTFANGVSLGASIFVDGGESIAFASTCPFGVLAS
jgi:hypothetical protein